MPKLSDYPHKLSHLRKEHKPVGSMVPSPTSSPVPITGRFAVRGNQQHHPTHHLVDEHFEFAVCKGCGYIVCSCADRPSAKQEVVVDDADTSTVEPPTEHRHPAMAINCTRTGCGAQVGEECVFVGSGSYPTGRRLVDVGIFGPHHLHLNRVRRFESGQRPGTPYGDGPAALAGITFGPPVKRLHMVVQREVFLNGELIGSIYRNRFSDGQPIRAKIKGAFCRGRTVRHALQVAFEAVGLQSISLARVR